MAKQYTIGIDPGTHTGLAVWSRSERQILDALTLDFWAALEYLEKNYPPDVCDVIAEDASKNKVLVYARLNGFKGTRVAANVGGVKRESVLLIEGLRRKGYNVVAIRPQSKKWSAEDLKRYTSYAKRTSEHARDAIRLCYGVNDVRLMEAA